jgi:hypothetical protein
MVLKALTRSTNNPNDGMPCCFLRSKALFMVCCASWQPMCPDWDLSPISASLFSTSQKPPGYTTLALMCPVGRIPR